MTQNLKRELGIIGAVAMGLGSIIGTGVFVSIGLAAGITGASVILAIMVAALVATVNGLNSAQLAANHPVSGGTYEYGYRYLTPFLGFTAGWMFLLAKSASAATAALGIATYLTILMDWDNGFRIPIALLATVGLMGIVLAGIRRSNQVNMAIVAVTVVILLIFVGVGLATFDANQFTYFLTINNEAGGEPLRLDLFLQATALMFVAYTGYGRIATLGEEVRNPRYTIPRAIILTLVAVMMLYALVAIVLVGNGGVQASTKAIAQGFALLETIAEGFVIDGIETLIAFGAITAMLSVLLNLILGLSRVLLAMGRRQDMPAITATINDAGTTPTVAVILVSIIIASMVLLGDITITWSFSAFSVLIYYSLTNLSALYLSEEERLYPRWIAIVGLLSCLFLAFWVNVNIWIIGLILMVLGWLWFIGLKRLWVTS